MKSLMDVIGQRVVQFHPAEHPSDTPVEALRRRPANTPPLTWPISWELLQEGRDGSAATRVITRP